MKLQIYLAGPDVFLENARLVGEQKQAMCRDFGFEGLFPLDNDEDVGTDPAKIFRANCALMRRADLGMFNLSPFRGPSADAGTVFELGFMFSSGKPVYGYSGAQAKYWDRVTMGHDAHLDLHGQRRDREGYAIENFDLFDNLMIARAIEDSGGAFEAINEPRVASLAAFQAFIACLNVVKERAVRSAI